ncbi:MAG TPA: MFS transporter [Candidatus Binatia bacterium]|nr:MFS transporter [Candidatus Binatia bacterium]
MTSQTSPAQPAAHPAAAAPAAVPPAVASRNPFAVRDFRLLWAGEAVSAFGDQFALIALPWLALVLTGSSLALGSVLALMAVPRALLMLIGGVTVDRLSPRRVMLISNAVRLVAVAALGAVVIAGAAELWMLYAFTLVFGVADAFFFPAQASIVPQLVEPDLLARANGVVQGTAQASVLVGPAVAGLVVAALGGEGATAAALAGIGVALLVDAATFGISLLTLLAMRARPLVEAASASILDDLKAAFRYIGAMPGLRWMVLVSLGANFFIVGPFEVGLPVIAYQRLPEGAAAFGVLMSAFGGGSLAGLAAGAMLPAPRPKRFAVVILGTTGLAGAGLALLRFVSTTLTAGALIATSGILLGYGNLLGITWLQSRVAPGLMGRVMSVLMLGSFGLVPVSMLLSGIAVQVSLDGLLLVAGVSMAVLTVLALLVPTVRLLGLVPPYQAPDAAAGAGGVASQSSPAAPDEDVACAAA